MIAFLRRLFGLRGKPFTLTRVLSDGSILNLEGHSAKDVERMVKASEELIAAYSRYSDEDIEKMRVLIAGKLANEMRRKDSR